jgi:hypothetical protein
MCVKAKVKVMRKVTGNEMLPGQEMLMVRWRGRGVVLPMILNERGAGQRLMCLPIIGGSAWLAISESPADPSPRGKSTNKLY